MIDSDMERAIALVPMLGEVREQLLVYETLLRRWQTKVNLVGPSTLPRIWSRHFADSMQLAGFAALSANWADIGSGAGFPGLVLALAQRRHGAGQMHLIESDTRKAAFLREVSRETAAGVTVHNARCEDVLPLLKLDVITSRAMASLPDLLKLIRTHVENGGIGLFLKGRDVESELTKTSISSNFSVKLAPSKIDKDGVVVRISAVA
jgi:16S rRNA (guanine527-N7)-methyltransferase